MSSTESCEVEPETGTNPADIRLAAMNLLARREHSRKELQHKLRRRFPDGESNGELTGESNAELIDEQLARLAAENLQSDSRYAQSYVRQRSGRGFGPVRVRQEMRERGLSDAEVDHAFAAADIDWSAVATEVYAKKFGGAPIGDIKERARRARFMQYRGFSADEYRRTPD